MFTKLKKSITKKFNKKVHHHVCKEHCKHVHRVLHIANHWHHHLGHGGELLLLGAIFITNMVGAGFTPDPNLLITDHKIIAMNLIAAENKGAPGAQDSKTISMWSMNSTVDNTFYPGYCTYGAALISPEFFPFTEPNKQFRSRGGNAVDRCANASASGFNIGTTPSDGSLIVYTRGTFGHVGKVMYYNSKNGKIIVRDMNRVNKFIMTDRRDDKTNSNIKCFIYPKKVVVPETDIIPIETIIQPTTVITGATINTTPSNPIIPTTPTIPTEQPTIPEPTISTATTTLTPLVPSSAVTSAGPTNLEPQRPTIIPDEEPTIIINPISNIGNIELNFYKVSDIAKHFLANRNIGADISSKTIKVGNSSRLTFTIKDANSTDYEGLLLTPIQIITSNNNIKAEYTVIGLVKDGKVEINIDGLKTGESTIIINFGGEKIGKVNLTIN